MWQSQVSSVYLASVIERTQNSLNHWHISHCQRESESQAFFSCVLCNCSLAEWKMLHFSLCNVHSFIPALQCFIASLRSFRQTLCKINQHLSKQKRIRIVAAWCDLKFKCKAANIVGVGSM